jgi:hypothetical protein
VAHKRIAILQSSYIPWKGYFDLIRAVDEFVLLDDVQYTRRDWRNRNRIKTRGGLLWLTIPVSVTGKYLQRIRDTQIEDAGWAHRHWRSITASYARAPHFEPYRAGLAELYARLADEGSLSLVNHAFISHICGLLGIHTRLRWSSDYTMAGGRTERLVEICRQADATEYLSGPSARAYIEPELFDRAGIALAYADYSGYPEYPQLYPPFEHGVSILALLFAVGDTAERYLLRF